MNQPAPKRIQLKRTKGWKKPEGAIVVSRPSKWGNPWRIVPVTDHRYPWGVAADLIHAETGNSGGRFERSSASNSQNFGMGAPYWAVQMYKLHLQEHSELFAAIRAELAGKSLACWCALDQPCHADVLLEIANRGVV